jgi:hypothetical protein
MCVPINNTMRAREFIPKERAGEAETPYNYTVDPASVGSGTGAELARTNRITGSRLSVGVNTTDQDGDGIPDQAVDWHPVTGRPIANTGGLGADLASATYNTGNLKPQVFAKYNTAGGTEFTGSVDPLSKQFDYGARVPIGGKDSSFSAVAKGSTTPGGTQRPGIGLQYDARDDSGFLPKGTSVGFNAQGTGADKTFGINARIPLRGL